MTRRDMALAGALLLLHLLVIGCLPGATALTDREITSLTGGILGPSELIASMKVGSVMPHPLPFWILAGTWANLTREPWLLRAPSILASVLTLLLILVFGSRHLSRSAGVVAGVLYACSPASGMIARSFGPESGLILAGLLAFHAFLSGWKRQGKYSLLLLLGAAVWLLYWHVYGIVIYGLLWITFGATLLWHGRLHRTREPVRPPVGELSLALGLAGLLYVPWYILVGRVIHMPLSPDPVTASAFYDSVLRGHGSGSIIGFVPLVLLSVIGAVQGLRTDRLAMASGRILLSNKGVLPTFVMTVPVALFVPCLFAYHRTSVTLSSPGGLLALLPLFLLLIGIGVSRTLPRAGGDLGPRAVVLLVLCSAVLTAIGWSSTSAASRAHVKVWEQAASILEGKVRDGDIVLVSPDDAKVYLLWAVARRPWNHLVRGEAWLSRFDAGPNLDRTKTIWLCEGIESSLMTLPRVKITRFLKVGGLDLGTPESQTYYVNNIDSRLESSEDPRQQFTYSWALSSHAKVNFPLESNRPASALIFRGSPFAVPQKVTIDLNKHRKAQIDMGSGWRHYIQTFEPPEFLPGEYARIDLHFSTHRPPTSPEGIPWRMKAVALDYVCVLARQQVYHIPQEGAEEKHARQESRSRRTPPGALQSRDRRGRETKSFNPRQEQDRRQNSPKGGSRD